eukprot:8888645-Alexandrium_andersonii.AAC.1
MSKENKMLPSEMEASSRSNAWMRTVEHAPKAEVPWFIAPTPFRAMWKPSPKSDRLTTTSAAWAPPCV